MLPGGAWRPDRHRTAAAGRKVLQVARHQRSQVCLEGDLQEYRVICVERGLVRPGQGGDVFLKLQNCEEGVLPRSGYAKPWSGQDFSVFQFNAVVERKPQPTRQERVNQATGWPKRREDA